jgi:DNA-directed RNA polymerase specialized sigma24 family protein
MSAQNSPLPDRETGLLRLFPRMIGYARGLGCSEEDAPALVRDVAIAALADVRPGSPPAEVEDVMRREIGIRCLELDARTEEAGEFLDGLRLAQKLLQLDLEALDRIDPDLRRVFLLRIFNRMGHVEIAKALGRPSRQVKALLARAQREIAAMRGDLACPGAMPRIAPASARLAAASASTGVRAARPAKRRLTVVGGAPAPLQNAR